MIRKLLPLLLLCATTAYGVESLLINSGTRDVINLGAVNFATGQLKVSGVAVVGGGGGGGGGGSGTIDNVRLNLPIALFTSPVNYTVSGGLAEGTAVLAAQDAGTVLANLTGGSATPIFVTVSSLKSSLAVNLVDNTSDANKPISTATQAALDVITGDVTTNTSDIATLTTSVAAKANTTTVNTALALKADITYVDTQDDTKQDSWGLPAVDGYIAAGNTDGSLHWVDPVTLGTTSQSFTDGVENSSTTFTSATANFVAGDVGKTITGDNIPAATTIASRTNSTTIILSAAATATGSGNDFTIINRLEVGGTGTVTSVAVGNLSPLFTSSVVSPSSSATVAYSLSSTNTNSFYGTGSFTTPTFMDASTARGSLGGTTVGQNLFTLTNPSLIKFIRINSDNTVSTRTAAEFRTDIGAGTVTSVSSVNNISPLFNVSVTSAATSPTIIFDAPSVLPAANTFYGNGTGSAAAATFMSASTARGALGGTTVGQNLFQLANPSAISYPRISATNTVTALTPSQVLSDIGGVATSDTRFPASVIGIRKSNGAGSSDTAAVANTDYARNSEMLTGATGDASGTWTAGTTVWRQSAKLTTNTRTGTLPAASSYASGTVITYIDAVTDGNFGRAFVRAGSDTLNGGILPIAPFIAGALGMNGSKTAYFETNGLDAWRLLGVGTADHVEDGTDASQRFLFSAALQTGSPSPVTGLVTAANGNSVTVQPTDVNPVPGVIRDITSLGTISKSPLAPTELVPITDRLGTFGSANPDPGPHDVSVNGDVDTVIIAGSLAAPYTINWPPASAYGVGKTLTLLDQSGSIGSVAPVTLNATSGDKFSGDQISYLFDEAYGRKVFTSDGATNWTTSTTRVSVQPFTYLTGNNGTFTIDGNPAAVRHNTHLKLQSGANFLRVNNPYDGMPMEFFVEQPSSGSAGTLSLPAVSAVAGGGAGLITLSSTNSMVDRLRGSYNGHLNQFMWDATAVNYTTAALPAAPSSLGASGTTSTSTILAWTDNASTETGFSIQRAPGLSQTTGFVEIATVGANVVTYTDPGLVALGQYTYQVLATNSAGSSTASNRVNVTADSGAPVADNWELHFNSSDVGTTTAVHTIGPNGTLTFADWATTSLVSPSTAAWAPIQSLTTTAVTVTHNGTPGATTVTYHVNAFRTGGILHNGYATVTNNSSTATLNTTDYNILSWPEVPGADYYEVYRVNAVGSAGIGRIGQLITGTGTITYNDRGTDPTGTGNAGLTGNAGSNDTRKITAASINYGSTGVLAYSFWVKSTFSNTTLGGGTSMFVSKDSGTGNGIKMFGNTSGTPKLQFTFVGASGVATGTVPINVTRNGSLVNSGTTWHHIVVMFDNRNASFSNSDIKVFFDKVGTAGLVGETVTYLTGQQSRTGPFNFTAGTPYIGSSYFYGQIDDFRIFNHALTASEINALFDGGPQ